MKDNPILDAGLSSESIEILSLATEDDYWLAEIRGLFDRLYPRDTKDERFSKFLKEVRGMLDQELVLLFPIGSPEYSVADGGLEQVLSNEDLHDAFMVMPTEKGKEAYFSLGGA